MTYWRNIGGSQVSFEIEFLGAAGTVTGSKYLVRCQDKKILIDCGLFQGMKTLRQRNWDKFPISPSEIDSVILTHAHIDHSGLLPKLVKEGYSGKIISTAATKDLAEILLYDSADIQTYEVEYIN